MAEALRVLAVSPGTEGGGAERIARDLARGLRSRGHRVRLAHAEGAAADADALAIPGPRPFPPAEALRRWLARRVGARSAAARAAWAVSRPLAALDRALGREDVRYPGSHRLLELAGEAPDLLHLHNLHGGYFDPAALPALSARVPTVVTLHDQWLLTGHCAQPATCERWRLGCGACPDLAAYPAIARDGTAANWRRKRAALARSRLTLVAPSRWLADRVRAAGLGEAEVVRNGVDLDVFAPGDRLAERAALGLPADARILVAVAAGMRTNPWKDWATLARALASVPADQGGAATLLLLIGESAPVERIGAVEVRSIGRLADAREVARHVRAADLAVHPALVDTYPTAVLEALACGVPVVASAVGGIGEQVTPGLDGVLVPPRDPSAFAAALASLLDDRAERERLAAGALRGREARGLAAMVDGYLAVYALARSRHGG